MRCSIYRTKYLPCVSVRALSGQAITASDLLYHPRRAHALLSQYRQHESHDGPHTVFRLRENKRPLRVENLQPKREQTHENTHRPNKNISQVPLTDMTMWQSLGSSHDFWRNSASTLQAMERKRSRSFLSRKHRSAAPHSTDSARPLIVLQYDRPTQNRFIMAFFLLRFTYRASMATLPQFVITDRFPHNTTMQL